MAFSLLFASAAFAKNPPGGKGVAETVPGGPDNICTDVSKLSKYLDRICIDKVQAKWNVGSVWGETIVEATVRWTLWSGRDFGSLGVLHGKGHGDLRHHIHLLNAPDFLINALNRMEITSMHIRGLVEPKYPEYDKSLSSDELAAQESDCRHFTQAYGASRFFVKFDPGALANPGKWSFSTEDSVPWDKLFDQIQNCPVTHSRYLDTAKARSLFNLGFRIARLDICGFNVAGLSSVDYALEQSCLAWDVNSDKYRKCMADCPPDRRYKKHESSRDRTATCTAQPPLRLAEPPRGKTPEDIEFAKLMEKELAAAAGISGGAPTAQVPSARTSGASSSGSLQSQLMAAAGIGNASAPTSVGNSAPFGLSDAQLKKVQDERAAEVAALVPKRESERNACYDAEPERPKTPGHWIMMRPGNCDDTCWQNMTRNYDNNFEALMREYREKLEDYDDDLARWKDELQDCLRKAEEADRKRRYELGQQHKADDKRLAEIYRLNQQLLKKTP